MLVERLNLAKSTVSRLVQQMRKYGWIERQRSPDDGRVWLWQLTPVGRTLAADVAQARQKRFTQIMAQIPEDARLSVIDSLNILVEAIRGNHTN
ncbi:MAG: MarR family transcriptional regulator [Anaerolineales bacterium]|nr:MarR family transcriptional regulator [Anaerolineales bacterium]